MKISIIHNLYRKNPYVNESVRYNLFALKEAKIDYQYILFNDKGDKEIFDDVKDIIEEEDNKIIYHYSDINYGKGKGTGGWLGALSLVNGDIIHNFGQDDVFVSKFYSKALETFKNKNMMFFSCNGIRTDENLNQQGPMINLEYKPNYSYPLEIFKFWFGINEKNQITRTNNGLLAPGTLYRTKLHDLIGKPSPSDFGGACDFEYWSRILFYEHKGYYEPQPYWLYRVSELSTSQQENDFKLNVEPNQKKIKEKYSLLWKEKMQ